MSDLDWLIRRLRGYSARAWAEPTRTAASRRDVVRRLADDLVALGGSGRELPGVPDHALPDAVAVLAAEAAAVARAETAERLRVALGQLS